MRTAKLIVTQCLVLLLCSTALGAPGQKIVLPLSNDGKSINLEFNGAIYDEVTSVKVSDKSTNKIAVFISEVIASNASGDKNKILGLWSDSDKKSIDLAMSNPTVMERNAALFRNIKSSSLMGYIDYGNYVICYVYHDISNGQGETFLKEYPLKPTANGYVLTNDLSSDFFFSAISYKLARHIWKR